MESLDARLERIRRKVLERGVRLDAPLAEADVRDFETRVGVVLPQEYRRFLLEVGDGPRARVDRDIFYARAVPRPGAHNGEVWYQSGSDDAGERARREGPPFYGLLPLEATLGEDAGTILQPERPFPLAELWIWEDEAQPDEARHQAVYADGHLNLGTEGCGEDWILVLSGPQRGRMWNRADVGAGPCEPAADFLEWYERWLDGRLHFD